MNVKHGRSWIGLRSCAVRRRLPAAALAVMLALGGIGATLADEGHDHGGSDAATEAEQQAAVELIEATAATVAAYQDLAVAEEAGYVALPFRAVRGGIEQTHAMNPGYLLDDAILDPTRPEGLMYLRLPDDTVVLIGAVYVAPVGEGPLPAGDLWLWHGHARCADQPGLPLPAGVTECPTGGETIAPRREMLHVWLFDHPDGRFAHQLGADGALAALAQLG